MPIQFKEYESKPIMRQAFQITSEMRCLHIVGKESTYAIWPTKKDCMDQYPEGAILFKAYQEPKDGDWVVRLTENDTYHVSDEVFRKGNVVDHE
jgi:hypothetical protein